MSSLSTKHVVLGLLADRTSYGYALQQQISDRFGFLGLAESSIYKTLGRLELDGCIEQAGLRGAGRSVRVLYRATPDGRETFKRWMVEPTGMPPQRDELHAKLILAAPDDLPQLLASVESQAEECLTELTGLAHMADATRAADVHGGAGWDSTARLLIEDFKARRLEALVDWLGEVAHAIQGFLDAQSAASAGRSPR